MFPCCWWGTHVRGGRPNQVFFAPFRYQCAGWRETDSKAFEAPQNWRKSSPAFYFAPVLRHFYILHKPVCGRGRRRNVAPLVVFPRKRRRRREQVIAPWGQILTMKEKKRRRGPPLHTFSSSSLARPQKRWKRGGSQHVSMKTEKGEGGKVSFWSKMGNLAGK